ncbi:segregation/condensation protein A [Candidatus Woesearchaeota archaeon]|nr:segregation/condensation protein A [Candidatus Woesearchaeota archaeon]
MTEAVNGNDKIFSILFNEDEVTWQSMIYNLVKTNEIDPWDVDVSELSTKFLDLLSKLKEMDFRISGKVLLAAAVLLKIKSNKFLGTDITNFENMFKAQEEDHLQDLEDFVFDDNLDYELMQLDKEKREKQQLIPRTPQPRERKVSIFDLVDALQRALDVRERRVINSVPQKNNFKVPEKTRDITQIIRDVYSNVKYYFLNNNSEVMKFNDLLPSEEKDDKIFTFLSLLHLTNERKVDMLQEQHRSPIYIKMLQK